MNENSGTANAGTGAAAAATTAASGAAAATPAAADPYPLGKCKVIYISHICLLIDSSQLSDHMLNRLNSYQDNINELIFRFFCICFNRLPFIFPLHTHELC